MLPTLDHRGRTKHLQYFSEPQDAQKLHAFDAGEEIKRNDGHHVERKPAGEVVECEDLDRNGRL